MPDGPSATAIAFRKWFLALAALPLLAVVAVAAQPAAAQATVRAEPEIQRAAPARSAPRLARAHPARTRHVLLASGFAHERVLEAASPGTPVQVGFPRAVAAFAEPSHATGRISWETMSDGRAVGALSVTSPGAVAMRMGLRIEALPAGAVLRFHDGSGIDPFEVPAAEALRAGPEYWSPVVESDTLALEVELPPGIAPAAARVAVPQVSHMVASAASGFAAPKSAGSCNVDAACHQAAWSNESNAVAKIVFTRSGSTFMCSGTLVADKDPATAIPYLLTAAHCVAGDATAATVQSYWFYRAGSCNGGRGSYRTVTGGAALLHVDAATDTSFLRLHNDPPEGATFAGWRVGAVPDPGAAVTGIHHPAGDLQKISFGNVRGHYACNPTQGDGFACSSTSASSATHLAVSWREGATETGSSGSALFADDGRYLVGHLYGGNGSCGKPGTDFYGRFDVAYHSGLARWLGTAQGGAPVAALPAAAGPAHDYTDLWWNPSESGWGLALHQHQERMFATWYVYDAGGRAVWVTMPGGRWETPTRFTGELWSTSGPAAGGPFDPAKVTRTKVGQATFEFTGPDRGTVSWTVNGVDGSKAIERQAFGAKEAAPGPHYGDLWWNPNQSGWGLSITQQGRSLFVVWFAYGQDSAPVWYVMSGGAWTSANTWEGTLYRTSSASSFFGGGFDPRSVALKAVGQMSLQFTATGSAVMSYTIEGASGATLISRQAF